MYINRRSSFLLIFSVAILLLVGIWRQYQYAGVSMSFRNDGGASEPYPSFKLIRTDLDPVKARFGSVSTVDNQTMLNKEKVRRIQWKNTVSSLKLKTKRKHLPKVIGIGVKKCGTGALRHFLKPHPLVRMADPIETFFFIRYPQQPMSAYREMMPIAEDSTLTVEKTPAYFTHPPYEIPHLIKKGVPDAKLILILCDPVKRVLSNFLQEWAYHNATGQEKEITKFETLDAYLDVYLPIIHESVSEWDEKGSEEKAKEILRLHQKDFLSTILTEGFYALHYLRWKKLFNSSQLMIIDGDEMFHDPGSVMEKVQEFVGIPKLLLKQDYVNDHGNPGFFCYKDWQTEELSCLPKNKQRSRNKSAMSDDVLSKLKKVYKSHNAALFRMLGRQFSWS